MHQYIGNTSHITLLASHITHHTSHVTLLASLATHNNLRQPVTSRVAELHLHRESKKRAANVAHLRSYIL